LLLIIGTDYNKLLGLVCEVGKNLVEGLDASVVIKVVRVNVGDQTNRSVVVAETNHLTHLPRLQKARPDPEELLL
jgi:hypothetical protein